MKNQISCTCTAMALLTENTSLRTKERPYSANGGGERRIEAYLVKRVKELGGEVRKVAWVGRVGAPDRIVMMPPDRAIAHLASTVGCSDEVAESLLRDLLGMVLVWPELKAPGLAKTFPKNAHERQQHREHERMRKMGQRVEVVDSYERIEEILK